MDVVRMMLQIRFIFKGILFVHPYMLPAKPICSTSRRDFGAASLTVKKNVPPAMKFLR